MLKHKYKIALGMAGLSLFIGTVPVSAADRVCTWQNRNKNTYVYVWKGEECGKFQVPEIFLPENCFPGTDGPGAEEPGTEAPDTEVPDVEEPETEVSGTEVPGTDEPDAEVPEEDSFRDAYTKQVFELVNQERIKAALRPLTYDVRMADVALVRAGETESLFSHTRPDGRDFSSALKDAGVSFVSAGENIAYGQNTPKQVVDAWMNSPGHRANILNAGYTRIGVGHYRNLSGVRYWTQIFAN